MEQPISSLDLPNNIIHKLRKNGFYYCRDLRENFESIRHKINIPNWPSITQAPVARTASELLEEESQPISTFIPELDALIKDEIVPNSITELTGYPGSGKTQVCFHLSLGVPQGETFFISTNKNFITNRLREIARLYVSDVESALRRIHCLEASDPAELLASVRFLETWLPDHDHIRLLIIDSISWPVKQKPIAERTSLVYTVFQSLRVLANKHGFAIVVTNSLTTRVKNGQTYHTSSFGDSFRHAVNNSVLLSKENGSFKARAVRGGRETRFNFK